MTIVESKGGVPYILRETFDLVGRKIRLGVTPKWFCVRVKEFPCKIYFSEDDYNDDVNYVGVNPPSEEAPNGEYIGSHDYKDLWIKGFNGSSEVELVATSAVSDLYLGEFSSGSVLIIPTSTIVTTKVGTFLSTWKGSGTLYFDPGDGGAVEPLVLTVGGVNWDHEYLSAGSKIITITGDLSGVTYLSAGSQSIVNSLNDIVKSLTSLTYLTMYGNSITGELSPLSKLMSLTYIRLDGNSITGELSPLSGLTSLTYLALSAMPSLTGNISSLSGLTSLATVYLHNSSLTGDLSSLSGLTNLALVYLYNNALTFTYTQFPAWSGSSYYLQSTVSTQQEVGDLIRAAANGGMNNCIYKLDGTNPAPPDTQEVTDAISTLAGNGVTLYVST
jgi:hypothetical protein